jgi:hypothetical protein
MSDPLSDCAVRRRLAVLRHVEEVSGNVAMTCHYFGTSRQLYFTWLRRYRAEGLEGCGISPGGSSPVRQATHTEVVDGPGFRGCDLLSSPVAGGASTR